MSKIPVELVAAAMKQAHVDPAKVREVIELINSEIAAQEKDEETPPQVKKQFVVLVSDPEGKLPKDDFVAWVLQLEEQESPATTLDRVYRGAYDFNCSKKGRMLPAKTVGDALENVAAKYFKEAGLWVKTRTPVLVVKSDNLIPKDETVTYSVNGKPIK